MTDNKDHNQDHKPDNKPECIYCKKMRAIIIWGVLMYLFFQYVYLA